VPTATIPAEEPLYLSIIWHQHQPLYYKDVQTGIYEKPWVRLHATKDYYDMAALLKQYPGVRATFNLTPSLIRQLDDFAAGAKDLYWVAAEKPADALTAADKRFLLRRFFDTNPKIIGRFPRYMALRDMRGSDMSDEGLDATAAKWTAQDFRDLQVLFNLAWMDPDFLAADPLKPLVEKRQGFTEADKQVVLKKQVEIIKTVIPIHAELQKAGQIEVTTSPYAHPILPLLISTNLAQQAMPKATLPANTFMYGQDAVSQTVKGVDIYKEHFGVAPRGMWPSEGSVAQDMVGLVSRAGLLWMASDEEVLARSLGLEGFTRDGTDTVADGDKLYRPYTVSDPGTNPVAIVFRDRTLSDLVGFSYNSMDGDAAADDFMARIGRIRESLKKQGAKGPHLATVILDGENAWEYYDNDGKAFLNALYTRLAADKTVQTITPSEFLKKYPDQPAIENLWAGSWINADFSTWIGEEEENTAWEYLRRTRAVLQEYVIGKKTIAPDKLRLAMETMFAAEGSDWFWWYGADQSSGDDEAFDRQFRQTLMAVYSYLDQPPPDWLYVPIIPATPEAPSTAMTGVISPTINGRVKPGEWAGSAVYSDATRALTAGVSLTTTMYVGFSKENLYLRLDRTDRAWQDGDFVGLYLGVPGAAKTNSFSRYGAASDPRTLLGFGAAYEVGCKFVGGLVSGTFTPAADSNTWTDYEPLPDVRAQDGVLEVAVPLKSLGAFDAGDNLYLRVAIADVPRERDIAIGPRRGPARITVPDLGAMTVVYEVKDPRGDDFGPGSYTYPTDAAFPSSVFDLESFAVGYDDENIVFKFTTYGPINNPWGSPNGLAVQTFDVYIDKDGKKGSGNTMLLSARNARVSEDDAWDLALVVEGWTPGVYAPDGKGGATFVKDVEVKIVADPGNRKVTVRVPKSVLGDNPAAWRYVVTLSSQDGYGPNRIRDVLPKAEQWRVGGAPEGTTHTRIIDLLWPADAAPDQKAILGTYTSTTEKDPARWKPENFCVLPMRGPMK
jgi:alpha-amylase/alpha-mannosidase (GH57 family)